MLSQHPAHCLQRPSPAIVAQAAVWRLPRWGLWGLCLLYSIMGLAGRQPWRSEEALSLAWMQALAEGRSAWWHIQFDGFAAPDMVWLPYWLGAAAMKLSPSFIPIEWAARLPFVLLLLLTLWSVWRTTYMLARAPDAQPLPFALGGEASPVDYARTLADGSVLALIASLGLAEMGHELGPTLVALAFVALWLQVVAAQASSRAKVLLFAACAAFGLALSGQVMLLLVLAAVQGLWLGLNHRRTTTQAGGLPWRREWDAVWVAIVVAGISCLLYRLQGGEQAIWHFGYWDADGSSKSYGSILRLLLWFTWPIGALALLALWYWHHWWRSPHVLLPLSVALALLLPVGLGVNADRHLLLTLPALAVLAAMFLPTMKRTVSAWIDWFTLVFFTACGFLVWLLWVSLVFGLPAKPGLNVLRHLPDGVFQWSWWQPVVAALASLLWFALIAWRVGRDRSALWKSLALPAGGAALCWALLMTLWLPLWDEARSHRTWATQVGKVIAASNAPAPSGDRRDCLQGLQLNAEQWAALRWYQPQMDLRKRSLGEAPRPTDAADTCPWLLMDIEYAPEMPVIFGEQNWELKAQLQGRSLRGTVLQLYQRQRD